MKCGRCLLESKLGMAIALVVYFLTMKHRLERYVKHVEKVVAYKLDLRHRSPGAFPLEIKQLGVKMSLRFKRTRSALYLYTLAGLKIGKKAAREKCSTRAGTRGSLERE